MSAKSSPREDYERRAGILSRLNAVEILDGLWVARCEEPIGTRSILWALMSALGDDDRAFVSNLSGPEWHAFNLNVESSEIVTPRKAATLAADLVM